MCHLMIFFYTSASMIGLVLHLNDNSKIKSRGQSSSILILIPGKYFTSDRYFFPGIEMQSNVKYCLNTSSGESTSPEYKKYSNSKS